MGLDSQCCGESNDAGSGMVLLLDLNDGSDMVGVVTVTRSRLSFRFVTLSLVYFSVLRMNRRKDDKTKIRDNYLVN